VSTTLADVLEKDWQRQVRNLAATLGYRHAYHTFNSRRSDTGFPDLVLVAPERRRVIYLELKRERGKLTPVQRAWCRALHAAGAEVYVARPRHLQLLADLLGRWDYSLARDQLLADTLADTEEPT
jgi:hypothetical protein